MKIISESAADGVIERQFELEVAGERVPGAMWSPAKPASACPVLLMGHGGGQHKQAPHLVAAANNYAKNLGFHVVMLDAPSHGERPIASHFSEFTAELRARIAEKKSVGLEVSRAMAKQAVQAVPEWRAAIDALLALGLIDASRPIGYFGLSMGAAIGVPLVAVEPRIKAAVFGLAGLFAENEALATAAAQVRIPIEMIVQWNDELISRESSLALFEAFGSQEKSLHANPGSHMAIPAFEREGWQRFFARHLKS